MGNELAFEWSGTPDVAAVGMVLELFETRGEVNRVRVEVDAEGLDIDEVVLDSLTDESRYATESGRSDDQAGSETATRLNPNTKSFWAGVALSSADDEWLTVRELTALLDSDDISENNVRSYLQTLERNGAVDVRSKETDGRGANPSVYRLSDAGEQAVGDAWTDAGEPPAGFPEDLEWSVDEDGERSGEEGNAG